MGCHGTLHQSSLGRVLRDTCFLRYHLFLAMCLERRLWWQVITGGPGVKNRALYEKEARVK